MCTQHGIMHAFPKKHEEYTEKKKLEKEKEQKEGGNQERRQKGTEKIFCSMLYKYIYN